MWGGKKCSVWIEDVGDTEFHVSGVLHPRKTSVILNTNTCKRTHSEPQIYANIQIGLQQRYPIDAECHSELPKSICGFAYANAWVEKYKQAQHKSTQRSKSLCKTLHRL